MLLPDFFYSKKFKVIITTILIVELLVILVVKIYSCFGIEPGCWNKKTWGTEYCMDHINSIYEAHKNDRSVGKYNKNSHCGSYTNKSSSSYSSGKKKSTPSYSANTYNYNNSHSTNRNDSYDVYNYDYPDDFADDWAKEKEKKD